MEAFAFASGITAGSLSNILLIALMVAACIWAVLVIFGMIKSINNDKNLNVDNALSQGGRIILLVTLVALFISAFS